MWLFLIEWTEVLSACVGITQNSVYYTQSTGDVESTDCISAEG